MYSLTHYFIGYNLKSNILAGGFIQGVTKLAINLQSDASTMKSLYITH